MTMFPDVRRATAAQLSLFGPIIMKDTVRNSEVEFVDGIFVICHLVLTTGKLHKLMGMAEVDRAVILAGVIFFDFDGVGRRNSN